MGAHLLAGSSAVTRPRSGEGRWPLGVRYERALFRLDLLACEWMRSAME